MSPLVAGMRPAKSCKDASSNETIVYSPAKSEGQMAVCSVPHDTFADIRLILRGCATIGSGTIGKT